MVKGFWENLHKPIFALAPMHDVTDAAFRHIIAKYGKPDVFYTEFVSTEALMSEKGHDKVTHYLKFTKNEHPIVAQVFGSNSDKFYETTKLIASLGFDGIDINMGCPAAKVVSSCHGSALMRDPDLAARLVEATVKAVKIPVSVKTRLGWDRIDTLIPFCKRLVDAGAQALAIHGRRYHDKFTGQANWDPIYALKEAVAVPVIGNGDIANAQDALRMIGNLDGVMVGRGTYGNPWVLKDIADAFEVKAKGEATDQLRSTLAALTFRDKLPVILKHCELAVKIKGETRGMLEMRRHLVSYIRGFDRAAEVRARIMKTELLDETKKILEEVASL